MDKFIDFRTGTFQDDDGNGDFTLGKVPWRHEFTTGNTGSITLSIYDDRDNMIGRCYARDYKAPKKELSIEAQIALHSMNCVNAHYGLVKRTHELEKEVEGLEQEKLRLSDILHPRHGNVIMITEEVWYEYLEKTHQSSNDAIGMAQTIMLAKDGESNETVEGES